MFNFTGVTPTSSTYAQAYPTPGSGTGFPTVSNINLPPRAVQANLVSVAIGAGGEVRLRNQLGSIHLLADLAGFYTSTAGVDHGSPPPTPSVRGVYVSASPSSAHPVEHTTVNINIATVPDAALTLTVRFRSGTIIRTLTADSGGSAVAALAVGSAPAGVAVPVGVTSVSDDLGSQASTSTAFTPTMPPPPPPPPVLTCRTSANPPNPKQNSNIDIIVTTLPGAIATGTFHYKTTSSKQSATANSAGRADIVRSIGRAILGFRVVVNVVVSRAGKSASCVTSFTPV